MAELYDDEVDPQVQELIDEVKAEFGTMLDEAMFAGQIASILATSTGANITVNPDTRSFTMEIRLTEGGVNIFELTARLLDK